jgi:two-component system, cell cycle sensor histidine kinase and response regulator CckA
VLPVLNQRSIAQAFMALQAAVAGTLTIFLAISRDPHALAGLIGALVYAACFVAFRRGWEPARYVAVAGICVLVVVATREPYLTQRVSPGIVINPVVALLLTSPWWIVGAALFTMIGFGLRTGFASPMFEPLELVVYTMAVSGMVLARISMDANVARLAAQVDNAEKERAKAVAAAREAIAERDRAGKLEATLLHMQRLDGVGRLAGGVAHDFNNLLTVIGASASMAERAVATGQSPLGDLEEVHLAVSRASDLTKQLLAFARKQLLVKRQVELNELVTNVERMLRRVIGANATLVSQLCSEPLRLMADSGQLEQVLVNLVINARDAIGPGGKIEIVTRRADEIDKAEQDAEGLPGGEYACLDVRDDGAGIAPEVQERLFEPFFTTKPPGKGTGLGLATSFGIVRQHEGTIRVLSEPGKGTTMRVLLPLGIGVEPLATSGVVEVVKQKPRVLVVEDEPQVRAIAARALSSAGFDVQQAANGALGLACVKRQDRPFDVVVTDVVMPELSGPDMARAVRELYPESGLVFMSGYPEAMQSAHAGEFAGAAFLAKPFSPQELVEAVRQRVLRPREEILELG